MTASTTPVSEKPAAPKKHSLRATIAALGQPRVASMAALGFSSGLPFMLTGATFGFWLADAGTSLTAIGFISWVGLAYSVKYLWSPLVDRISLPFIGKLGRRRSWTILAQILIAAALLGMALVGPKGPGGLLMIGALALVVAFASATQDIAIDAWRIEASSDPDEMGLLSSANQLGYRVALLVSDALILAFAQHIGWPLSYSLMALLMGVGFAASLMTPEPELADAVMRTKDQAAPLWTPRGLFDAIVGPFIDFFRQHGAFALLMMLMISVYRLPEFVIGPPAGKFYTIELGISKDVIAGIRGSVGLISAFLGIAVGGFATLRLGFGPTLVMGAILQGVGVSSYAVLAMAGPDLRVFASAMFVDNFCYAFGGVALIAYMSSLTSLGYTATQYALMSSLYASLGKFLKGFSGAVIDGFHAAGHPMRESYMLFYICAGLIALPAVVLCLILLTRKPRVAAAEPATSPA